YDAILGKPWLYQINPHIDWRTNTLSLNDGPRNIKISASTSRTTKKPECHSLLISRHQLVRTPADEEIFAVCATSEEVTPKETYLSPEEAIILKEFANVFPAELPNQLPPKRKIDHAIDLVPGAELPSRPTYRLSYVEIDELKKQLADLTAKGFIRP
ncbi:17112_t:CDS:1, partial [Acaulospora morrowiae]